MVKRVKRFPKPSLSPQQADGVLRSASGRKSLIVKSDDVAKLRGIKPNLTIKRMVKKIEGLKRQEKKHLLKLEHEVGKKDTTADYWRGEIERFREQRKIVEGKLKKLRDKK
ncbi:MAG: hypothetical protein Q7S74_03195 [Nanoarchaeota archaeon]|nr:hypothetical protein [Nanoarchaeota archaeon]